MRPYTTASLYYIGRRNQYFFIGCFAGFILSSVFVPLFNDCHNATSDELLFGSVNWSELAASNLLEWRLNTMNQLEIWYAKVQFHYRPVLLNGSYLTQNHDRVDSIDDEASIAKQAKQIQQSQITDKKGILVRDKKLNFYRPRFHQTELSIKSELLVCVLIRQQYLNEALNRKPFSQGTYSFLKWIISQHMNYTSNQYELINHQLDVFSFYPELIIEDNDVTFSGDSLMVSSEEGRKLERLLTTNRSEPKHISMLRFLVDKGVPHQYSFIFLITESTLISTENLLEWMEHMSVADYVLTANSGKADAHSIKIAKSYIRSQFAQSDTILEHGLLLSSSLLLKCQTQVHCMFKHSIESSDLNLSGNLYYIHHAYHLAQTQSSSLSLQMFNVNFNKASLSRAVTVYPVHYDSEAFNLILLLITHYRRKRLQLTLSQIESELKNVEYSQRVATNNVTFSTTHQFNWPLGVFGYQKPHNRYEVSRWIYWNESHVLMPNDVQVVRPLNAQELAELRTLQKTCKKWADQNEAKSVIKSNNTSIKNIYRKFDAVRGLEYLVDLAYEHAGVDSNVRLQIVRPLNPVELMLGVPYVSEKMRLTLVLPVRGQMEVPLAIQFLNNYANVCLKKANHHTTLIIALIYTRAEDSEHSTDSIASMVELEKQEFDRLKKASLYVQSKFIANSVKINFLDIDPPNHGHVINSQYRPELNWRYPSELVYLDLIARSLIASSSNEPFLLLHCRSNMLFSMDLLNRVRLNTIAGKQVFMPIPFVEYRLRSTSSNSVFQQSLQQSNSLIANLSASIAELANKAKGFYFDVRRENGYFDETNFEFIAFYLSDYLRARQMTQQILPIVRNHQSLLRYQHLFYGTKLDLQHLFTSDTDGFVSAQQLIPMRAVEPELRLFHAPVLAKCGYFESNENGLNSCRHRSHHGLGSKQKLASIVIEYLQQSKLTMDLSF